MKHIGDLINDKCTKQRGMKKKLADACGVTPQAVNGWIKTGKVDKKHFPAISMELNIPIQVLHGLNLDETASDSLSNAISEHLSYEDEDIVDLVKWWPNLPENIKNSIRLLLQSYLENLAPQLSEYLQNVSRPKQAEANNHFKSIPKKNSPSKDKS